MDKNQAHTQLHYLGWDRGAIFWVNWFKFLSMTSETKVFAPSICGLFICQIPTMYQALGMKI